MTSPSPDSPSSTSAPGATRPPVSEETARQHSDDRFNDFERRATQQDSMKRTRWLMIAGIIAVGSLTWLILMR